MTIEVAPGELDLTRILRSGDSVLWGQATSEPLTLTEALVRQRAEIGRVNVFVGPIFSNTVRPEHSDHISVTSYGGFGNNQRLAKAGVLDILPCHVSNLPALITGGAIRCDVAFLQLSAQNASGEYSFGVANDYMLEAAHRARVVVAEVNDQAPWTYGGEGLSQLRIDYIVRTSRPVLEVPVPPVGEVEKKIAAHAGRFIEDGAVLEMGIGAIPNAILSTLRDRRDLGIHSGMIGDSVMELVEAGAVTNALKPIDRGIITTGVLIGTSRLYRFANGNTALHLRPVSHTHDARVLGRFEKFIAINSAIEVDLTGQVNAEIMGKDYVGAVGGQVDFVRAACQSHGGRSIIALPSTARNDTLSRITDRLSGGITTTPRSDADIVVTEWGAAELRGRTVSERVRRMIEIAHPAFRESLEREAHGFLRAGRR